VKPADQQWSDGHDKLGVDVGEACELGLVKVHDEQLVRRRQLGCLVGKLAVKVAYVFYRFLRTVTTPTSSQCSTIILLVKFT